MKSTNWYAVGGGALTGACNGLFGGGGGMVAVPYLEHVARYPTTSAHATAIAVVLPATLTSAIVYLLFSLVPFFVLLPVAIGVLFGGIIGAKLLGVIKPQYTAVAFAALMLVAGVRMLL